MKLFAEWMSMLHALKASLALQITCVKLSARMTAVKGSSPAVRGTPDTFLGAIAASSLSRTNQEPQNL